MKEERERREKEEERERGQDIQTKGQVLYRLKLYLASRRIQVVK